MDGYRRCSSRLFSHGRLKVDGTVITAGSDSYGECNLSDWTDIVAVAADTHSIGLKNDGTVVAAGSKLDNRCDVSGWTNIGPRE